MPHDLPHWSTVYHYFRKWQKGGVWEKVAQVLARRDREREGRYASPSALVMDSQSVVTGIARILQTGEKGGPVDTFPSFVSFPPSIPTGRDPDWV